MAEPTRDLADSRGFVCTLALSGSVKPQYSECMLALARFNDSQNLKRVEYKQEHGLFIETARDEAVMHALDPRGDRTEAAYDWLLMIDADATFPQDTLWRLLYRAYIEQPNAGVVGAYSQLKPYPHVPTIDTGTGTWEEHYPGEGMLQVIRTGGHCLLIKLGIFQKTGPPPWFRTRHVQQPIRAMRDLDNFARTKLSGKNPFREHPEWETLFEDAMRSSTAREPFVGEDSAFFDRCRAHNVPCYVDTDLVTGHVSDKVIQPMDFRDAVRKREQVQRAALGVYV